MAVERREAGQCVAAAGSVEIKCLRDRKARQREGALRGRQATEEGRRLAGERIGALPYDFAKLERNGLPVQRISRTAGVDERALERDALPGEGKRGLRNREGSRTR